MVGVYSRILSKAFSRRSGSPGPIFPLSIYLSVYAEGVILKVIKTCVMDLDQEVMICIHSNALNACPVVNYCIRLARRHNSDGYVMTRGTQQPNAGSKNRTECTDQYVLPSYRICSRFPAPVTTTLHILGQPNMESPSKNPVYGYVAHRHLDGGPR